MSLVEVTAPKVSLVPGAVYFAKLQLTGFEATLGTAGAVRGKFQGIGFGDVTVWEDGPPADKFPDVTAYPDGKTFWAEGTWNGTAESRALPSQVRRVWTARAEGGNPPPSPGPSLGPTPETKPTPRKAPAPKPAPKKAPPTTAHASLGEDAPYLVLGLLLVYAAREPW